MKAQIDPIVWILSFMNCLYDLAFHKCNSLPLGLHFFQQKLNGLINLALVGVFKTKTTMFHTPKTTTKSGPIKFVFNVN